MWIIHSDDDIETRSSEAIIHRAFAIPLGTAAIYSNVFHECEGNFSPDIQIQRDRRGHFQINQRMQRQFVEKYGDDEWTTDNQLKFFFACPSDGIERAQYDELMRMLTLPEYSLKDVTKGICRLYIKPDGNVNFELRYATAEEFLCTMQ